MCRYLLGKWYALPPLLLFAACGGGGGGGAALVILGVLQASLLGSHETTVIDPAATATAMIELRSDGRVRFAVTVEERWRAEINAMHIHRGPAGADGPVVVDLLASGATFDAATRTAAGSVFASPALVQEIVATPAAFYVNIHTASAPNGLVRQQLGAVAASEWHTLLLGDQETTVVDAQARGAASFRVSGPGTLAWVIAMTRPVIGDINAAHIHVGPAGADGTVLVDLRPGQATLDAAAGTLSGTVTVSLEALARILQDPGAFYCNVHSLAAPNGIARGQLATGMRELWAVLRGDEETTVVDPAARGGASIFLETLTSGRAHIAVPTDTLDILDLVGAHIHPGRPGEDGAIAVDLRAGADYNAATATGSGEGSITYTQALFTRLLADPGAFYVNIHTPAAPAGLARGQLTRDPQTFFAGLSGAQEVAVVDPNAAGSFVGIFSSPTRLSYTLTMASPPPGDLTGAHIHDGPAGQNGNILVDLFAGDFEISGDTITGSVAVTGRTLARMLAAPHLFYVNVHTALAPNGIARAQTVHAEGGLPPAGITYDSPVVYQTGSPIPANVPRITPGGGGITSFSVDPPLPAGLVIDAVSGIISGTPTQVQASTIHRVTASNSAGFVTFDIDITVNVGPPTNLVYSANPATYVQNTPITPNTPSNQGGAISSYTVQAGSLPAGLTLNATTGVITGTPTAAQPATGVTIRGSNAAGFTDVVLTITVNATLQPPNISYSTPVSYPTGYTIAPNTPTNTGGAVSSYSVQGAALPAGLSLNTTTGAITGKPTAVTPATNYTIRASNAAGFHDATVNIATPLGAPTNLQYSGNNYGIGYVGQSFTLTVASVDGGAVSSYSIESGTLPAGLSLNTSNGTISGTPTAEENKTVTIKASNAAGSTTRDVQINILP